MGEKINPVAERERLAKRYAAMSDLELEKVGRNPGALTEWAFLALGEEMAKRGLDWTGKELTLSAFLPKSKNVEELNVEESEDTPVIVRQYRDMPQALTDRMILNSAGIDCYLFDENTVRLDWLWSNLLGGIKLVVRQKDADETEKLLSNAFSEKFAVDGVGDYEQERCPQCGSMEVSCDELKKRIAAAGILLIGVPLVMIQRGWNCHACGYSWDVSPENASGPIVPPNS
jgi:hypothetical protein